MPSVYNTVFGGNVVAPAIPTYLSLPIAANVILGWPLESNITSPAAAEIIDVTASVAALTIQLSDARQVSNGYCALVNNIGVNTFTLLDAQGNALMAPASGQVWQIYLADNSTLQGTWRVFQYGAGVSSANAASLAGSGLKAIATTLNERILINAQSANYVIGSGAGQDRASCIEWVGGSGSTLSSLTAAALGSDWFCYIKNNGTGVITFTPGSGTVNGSASQTFNPNDSAIVVTDGANFFTIGLGQSVASSFNFVTISLAGASGTVVLSGAQLNRISYKFTGALANNTVIQVPASIQQYWVDNETTGAFTLTISAGGGATFAVPQATRTILYCDGLNIVNAVSSGAGSTTLVADGTAAAPGLAWASDTQMGLYKVGTDILGLSTAGVQRVTVNSTGNVNFNAPTAGVSLTVLPLGGQSAININAPTGSNPILNFLINSVSDMELAVAAAINQGVGGAAAGDSYLVTAGGSFLVSTNGGTGPVAKVDGFGHFSVLNGVAFGSGLANTTQITMQAGGSNVPQIALVCSGAAANARIYDTFSDTSGTLHLRTVNDAYGASNDWMTVTRNGLTPTGISSWGPIAAAAVDLTPDSGSFLVTYTGMAAAVTGTAFWGRIGKLVTVILPLAVGTSNSTNFTITGIPAVIQPPGNNQLIALGTGAAEDNTATNFSGAVLVANSSNTWTMFKNSVGNTGWTAAGTKGFAQAAAISYLLS